MNSLGTDFDTVLTRGALGALVVAVAWALVVVGAIAAEARSGGRVRIADRTGCPPAVRAWLLGVCVAMFAAVPPAQATDAGPDPGATIGTAVDGLPLPDRTAGHPARPHSPRSVVEVRPGDSLWRIAHRLLPDSARDSEIAAAVARLYAANGHTIGPDPDLLRPGQRLVGAPIPNFPDPTTPSEEQ